MKIAGVPGRDGMDTGFRRYDGNQEALSLYVISQKA